ncbi:cyclophilin type peptidyl-prolyl cis-trans isomerase [Indivirus ILV1]|uniref:peptidylprolyl isomerase n=1 Tax=Indivirus ILV1 TaxID=1977633 RepID=A0A1V0SCU1_9VIRU|nr:cyclophilin type peptidyl-prolyl cis-trans isomerase [Indivirus ILV1]
MEDINRLLILLLLIGLLYVIYKYQHLIFTKERFNDIQNLIYSKQENNIESIQTENKVINNDEQKISIDNISQLSINSLEDEDGERQPVYKPDSILGSLDNNSLFISDEGTNKSLISDASSFFFLNQNPVVYFEFATQKNKLGKLEIELYQNIVPKTVNNFIQLIKTNKYNGCNIHRIIPGFMIQTGDFTKGNGSGGYSIYGKYFEDENFELDHDQPGVLSMANCGPNTNGSQFFITLDKTPWLNGKHVVFGKVINGMEIVKKIEKYGSEEGTTSEEIRIINCGLTG